MLRYDLDESEMCQDDTGKYVLYADVCYAQNEHNARLKKIEIAIAALTKIQEIRENRMYSKELEFDDEWSICNQTLAKLI